MTNFFTNTTVYNLLQQAGTQRWPSGRAASQGFRESAFIGLALSHTS